MTMESFPEDIQEQLLYLWPV